MESLYKIDKIEGKGLGWIALHTKCGTLICKEKPQFVHQNFWRVIRDACTNDRYDVEFCGVSKIEQNWLRRISEP